jgi:hypothetical protein
MSAKLSERLVRIWVNEFNMEIANLDLNAPPLALACGT